MIIRCRLTLLALKLFLIICMKTVKLTQWFGDTGMKANPNKFKFMLLSPNQQDVAHLKSGDDISINSNMSVKVLVVIIDNRLTFTEHISI